MSAEGAWIDWVEDGAAEGELARLYDAYRDRETGVVDNILKIHSLSPASLEAHFRFYETVMHADGPLTRARREMVAVAVSALNRCRY